MTSPYCVVELTVDIDCPDCSTSYYGVDVTWAVSRYGNGQVLLEQYFNCPGGSIAGSPQSVRGCGPTYARFLFSEQAAQL